MRRSIRPSPADDQRVAGDSLRPGEASTGGGWPAA